MSFDYPTETDAALLLDGLADVLELLPAHDELGRNAFLAEERADVVRVCRYLAKKVHPETGQSFDDAKGYAGAEVRNAVLRALFGTDGSIELLEHGVSR